MQANQLKQTNNTAQHAQRKHLDPAKHGHLNKGSPNAASHSTNGTQSHAGGTQIYCRLAKTTNHKFENLDEANKIFQFESAYMEFTKCCPNDSAVQEQMVKDKNFYRVVSKAAIFAFPHRCTRFC
ncbi:hypothetical protein M3Y97_00390400 [Aphelenchoides bicaudatus]|nr:hypothetical protein M3Y97_00390400 [Aphelenchoides bicaudatus]